MNEQIKVPARDDLFILLASKFGTKSDTWLFFNRIDAYVVNYTELLFCAQNDQDLKRFAEYLGTFLETGATPQFITFKSIPDAYQQVL